MEKRFVWIKLKQDFFDSPEMDWIHEQQNGAEYIYIYLRLCLLSINDDGIIERRIGPLSMPYSIPKLAEKVKTTPDAMAVALSLFKKIGLIEEMNGIYAVPGLANMVGSESASAERVRKYRLRKRQNEENLLPEGTPKALHCNEKVTKNVTLEIRDKSIEIRIKKEETPDKPAKRASFQKPSLDDVKAYCKERNNKVDPSKFLAYYESNGWKVGRNAMKD